MTHLALTMLGSTCYYPHLIDKDTETTGRLSNILKIKQQESSRAQHEPKHTNSRVHASRYHTMGPKELTPHPSGSRTSTLRCSSCDKHSEELHPSSSYIMYILTFWVI